MITAFFLAILAIVLGFVASILPTVAFPSAITTSISLIMGYINSFSFLFPVSTLLSVVVIAFSFWLALWALDAGLYILRYIRGD